MSQRSSILGDRNGFQRIPEMQPTRSGGGGGSPDNDATIDIPLTTVATNRSGQRKVNGFESNEKRGFHLRGGRRRPARELRGNEVEDVNTMGKIYNQILNFSIITRYLLYILPVGLILAVPIIVGAVLPTKPGIGGVRIVWIFAWGLTMWVGLWASKLFAKILPFVFEFLCGIVSPGTRKYSTIIKALEIPLSLVGWALVSLSTFIPILTKNSDPFSSPNPNMDDINNWENVITRVLAAFLASSGIFLVEKTLIQLISVNYHRMQYELKIKESKQNVHILCMLYDASIAQFPAYCPEFQEEDYLINDSPDLGGSMKGHHRSGSATPMRILANVGRFGDRITAAFGNIAQEVTGKEVFNPTSAHSIVVEALEKKRSQEALAKRIWMSLVAEGKEALYQEDLIEVLVDQPQSVAIDAFQSLDNDGNGDVNLDEMILKVCEIGRARKAIASSLHDVDQAINVLDNLLLTLVLLLCVFVFIAFLNESFVTTLATAGTALLSLSFVFSGTAQEVLGSCIFLFVKHPFDVGDIVNINSQQLVVERVSLLYSVFKCTSSHTTTQCPNVVLNGLWIDNITRSKAMREQLHMYVSFDTTLEDVELLRREMQNFVQDKDNSRDFEPDVEIDMTGIAEMNKLELKIQIKHKSNWSNGAVAAARRSKFMCALVLALRKVPIFAPGGGGAALGSADQPSYSVAVSDEQAAAARATFERSKADKHMKAFKPLSKAWNDLGVTTATSPNTNIAPRQRPIGPTSETEALNALSSRSPAADDNHEWQTEDDSPVNRRPGSGPRSPVDSRRSAEVDEAYGLLRRASTRGKRRESYGLASREPTNNTSIPIIEEPANTSTTSLGYHDYARQVANNGNGQAPAKPPQARQSPPRQPARPIDNGFGASNYNPYVQTAPIYEYPSTMPSEEGPGIYAATPTSPITQRIPTGNTRPSTANKSTHAAELEGERHY